jgi:hypothetical protein
MPIQKIDEEEDWYDDPDGDDDLGDHESPPCPECGEPVPAIADRCPECGYWITDADRRAMWAGESNPMWMKITAVVLLALILASIALGVF